MSRSPLPQARQEGHSTSISTKPASSPGGDPVGSPYTGSGSVPSLFNVTISRSQQSDVSVRAEHTAASVTPSTAPISTSEARPQRSANVGMISSILRSQSLAESVRLFDPARLAREATQALAGSGLLTGDTSAALPASIHRAEEVLQHVRQVLARADRIEVENGLDGDGILSTQELEGMSGSVKRALFICPNHRELQAMRGDLHRRLQDFRTAVGSLRLAVRMDKSDLSLRQRLAEVLLSQGMVWVDAGDNEAALACFEEACTVDGANASAHFFKTITLVKLKRFVEALASMECVMGRKKGTADDYVLRAKIRWAVGMVGPGNTDMEMAQGLWADHPEVIMFQKRCLGDAESLYTKAQALADKGEDIMAVKVLDQVSGFTPDDVKVPVMRAACKRRLKDFVGALKDYDKASFMHFQGVHVGRQVLHAAVNQLRHARGAATIERANQSFLAGRAVTEKANFDGERLTHGILRNDPSSDLIVDGNTGAGVLGLSESMNATVAALTSGEQELGAEVTAYAAVEGEAGTAFSEGGRRWDRAAVGYAEGMSVEAPPAEALKARACSGGTSVGGLREMDRTVDGLKFEETMEMQATHERMKETNLRKKFRLAIPHAGQDPDYSLHSCSPHYDELLLGTLPTASLLTRGGGRGDLEESKLQREGGDESYEEPRYITRQRCLALNEWALDLFDHKRYGQAVMALNLAIVGDGAFARATGGAMESKFFLNRGDCHRANGSAELAVQDYKRALEVEPGNWMVKTRLALAHHLKGNSLFNRGDFDAGKRELDSAIAYNWKVSAFYLARGQMLYFSGRVSEGHADYRQALELDPSNAEAKRLCRQFDPKGKIAAARVKTTSTAGRKPNDSDNSSKVHRSSASTMRVSESISARYPVPPDETTSTSECEKSRALYPPYQRKRSSRKGRRRLSDTLESPYEASTTTAVATSDSTSPCRCQGCRAASRGAIVVPSAPISSVPRVRMMRGGSDLDNRTNHSETCEYRRQSTRRETKCLPKLGGRIPFKPERGHDPVFSAKASEAHLERMLAMRSAAVPEKDERLWGMLRVQSKGWAAAGSSIVSSSARLSSSSSLTLAVDGGSRKYAGRE